MTKPVVVAVANRKGGVGKSASAESIALILAEHGSTLIIDMDQQGTVSSILCPEHKADNTSASLYKKPPFLSAYPATQRAALDVDERAVIPNLHVSTANKELEGIQKMASGISIFGLQTAIANIQDEYQYIVIDCPPNGSDAQSMALMVADYLLVPVTHDMSSMEGADELFTDLNIVIKNRGSAPKIGIFLNIVSHQSRTAYAIARTVVEQKYPEYLLDIEVPHQGTAATARSAYFTTAMFSRLNGRKSKPVETFRLMIEQLKITGDKNG
ncbi:ParA family protein [Pseudomonas syringae pv. actinidiae]|uniref:ParA family protein n=1 Tax=Pseudomonas syringae TaxID=317 RepID=UPI000BB593D2|nr:ParA family protein [Pseudomonas syringae]PBK49581.1 hypothetical protein BUE61_22575 [Pseudomonas syringae pv. actinidiae]PBK54241.1 hypothetical protein BUE60_10380 [Pseudomonas syringae pv. actinidiae]RJX53475.1 ParA family protein [Pseudomonas syringae pv. actinidiae]RJX55593.1 ParA family protein [Pseudomonas syringae pv. actinidiae]RJX63849.1 ParA family protein [Pseudomonas syringae pv. actinidiae]